MIPYKPQQVVISAPFCMFSPFVMAGLMKAARAANEATEKMMESCNE